MAFNSSADSESSSNRNWHWSSLHSWNIFSSRVRSRDPPEPPPTRNYHRSRPLRGGRHHIEGPSLNSSLSSSSSSSTYTGTIAAESARRRRTSERGSEAMEMTSAGHRLRAGPNLTHQQHHHNHHHDHHHHNYHLSRHSRGDLERGTTVTRHQGPSGIILENESTPGSSTSRNDGRYRSAFFPRFSFTTDPRGVAREARERLDERFRAAALTNHRRNIANMPGNYPDDYEFLFEDDNDFWSDEEIWETSMRDWLAAWDTEERWRADTSSPERLSKPMGISKAQINNLAREVFVPNGSVRGKEFRKGKMGPSEQEDCPVCLEHFLPGETLLYLPCKHRFHPDCLTPWLASHTRCPYCRADITCEETSQAVSSSGNSSHGMPQGAEAFLSWTTGLDSSFAMLNLHSQDS